MVYEVLRHSLGWMPVRVGDNGRQRHCVRCHNETQACKRWAKFCHLSVWWEQAFSCSHKELHAPQACEQAQPLALCVVSMATETTTSHCGLGDQPGLNSRIKWTNKWSFWQNHTSRTIIFCFPSSSQVLKCWNTILSKHRNLTRFPLGLRHTFVCGLIYTGAVAACQLLRKRRTCPCVISPSISPLAAPRDNDHVFRIAMAIAQMSTWPWQRLPGG